MSSIGASFAQIYVQQNAQKDKLKIMEEEAARSRKVGNEEKIVSQIKCDNIKKVYPVGNLPSGFTGSYVESNNSVNE